MLWILGNNARNLLYIRKFNDKKAIRLANNKLETKNFLSERWIPFAKTYAILKNRNELYEFDFSSLPKKNFVIKPNHGSKGNGIYITKYLWKSENLEWEEIVLPKNKNKKSTTELRKDKIKTVLKMPILEHRTDLYQINNKPVSDNDFRRKLLDIIDGKYSMTLWNDKIIVEEKLIPGELFKEFCARWLADIRIIVFNLVPVATMIRVPTEESKWKANLAQWWIWLWIDIATGKVINMLYKNKMYKNKFPEKYADLKDKKIPYRNDILFLSSKVQYYVNLWYLALDWVITNDGPKLLEINARAGLEVQKVTDTRLARTLDKISDLKINDPEKWVEIAKSLFTKEHSANRSHEKILYLSQYGKLLVKKWEEEIKKDIVVEVNLDKSTNRISSALYEFIKGKKTDYSIDLFDNDIILKTPKLAPLESLQENKIILWKKTAEEFLIKPIHKTIDVVNILTEEAIIPKEHQELLRIDVQLNKINRKLNLSSKLRPTNYFNELDKFITMHGNYNPVFTYKRPSQDNIKKTADEIKKIGNRISKLESPMKQLFLEKIEELNNKLLLIKAYREQDFKEIEKYNNLIFWEFNPELISAAKDRIFWEEGENESTLWDPLKLSEIEDIIENYLAQKKIYGIDIVFSYSNLSRISVIMGKSIRISISKQWVFREKELFSILAHEIDTHLIRHLNGTKTGWNIFKSWTGDYLKDEEWLAIYNAKKYLPEWYEKNSIYKKYFLTKEAEKLDFIKLVDLIGLIYPNRWTEWKFKTALRIKKWVINTSKINPGTVFKKDKIYLDGYIKINNFVKQGNSLEKMYKGKVKIEDLEILQ